MDKLRILLTNNTLRHWAGSEMAVLDLARQFRKLGHYPVAYSSDLGPVAEELRRSCIPVTDDLREAGFVPDIIHGQHHLDAMTAMLKFPDVPAIYVCHGWMPWQETPPVFSNILKYVAVSQLTAEKVRTTRGIESQPISIVANGVDLQRFKIKDISAAPRRAAIFSNYVGDGDFRELVVGACRKSGIEAVDVIGAVAKHVTTKPEESLRKYDLVFAIGRSALEAMAIGCGVIVVAHDGLAGFVGPEQAETWSGQNFGMAILDRSRLAEDVLLQEIRKYDQVAVARTREFIRHRHDLVRVAEEFIATYREAIDRWRDTRVSLGAAFDPRLVEASNYLANVSAIAKSAQGLRTQLAEANRKIARMTSRMEGIRTDLANTRSRIDDMLKPSIPADGRGR